jgi:Flp pilus assembly protein TadD
MAGTSLIRLVVAVFLVAASPAFADEAKQVYPNDKNPQSLNTYAKQLLADGHAAAAIPFLLSAIEMDPSLADAYMNLGHAYTEAGRTDKAIEAYERYMVLRPNEKREDLANISVSE